jgi:hypothetical protein
MASPKVIVADTRYVTCAKATDMTSNVISTHGREMGSAEAADVASTEATHVATSEAAHMASASAEAATPVASAAATAGLRIRNNKAAGKQRSCQDHHHSSSHDILLLDWRTVRQRHRRWHRQQGKRQRRDALEVGMHVWRLH